jgi:hypothetical protein
LGPVGCQKLFIADFLRFGPRPIRESSTTMENDYHNPYDHRRINGSDDNDQASML